MARAPRTPVTPLEIRVAYNDKKVILYMLAHKCQLSYKHQAHHNHVTLHFEMQCDVIPRKKYNHTFVVVWHITTFLNIVWCRCAHTKTSLISYACYRLYHWLLVHLGPILPGRRPMSSFSSVAVAVIAPMEVGAYANYHALIDYMAMCC